MKKKQEQVECHCEAAFTLEGLSKTFWLLDHYPERRAGLSSFVMKQVVIEMMMCHLGPE
jgi:hypothetical protein